MFAEFNWMEAITTSPIFLVLIGLSVITLGVALERTAYFLKRNGDADGILTEALKRIRSGDVKEGLWAIKATRHPLGSVANHVFDGGEHDKDVVEEKLQVSLSQEKLLLERNVGILGTMAAIAPLVGLLGTVWGIMRAFSDMASTGSAAPSVVAAGVAEALVTTAAGLVIAVPAVMLYNHFSRRMNVMLTEAENHVRSIRTALTDKRPPEVPDHERRKDKRMESRKSRTEVGPSKTETPSPATSKQPSSAIG